MTGSFRKTRYAAAAAAFVFCLPGCISFLPGAQEAFRIEAMAAEDEDYSISGAWWADSMGSAEAEWEKASSSTRYRLQLYRGSKSTAVGKSVTTSGSSHDFSSAISKKGTGDYFYTITPVKGGEAYTIVSEVLEVDSDRMQELRNYLKDKKEAAAAAFTAPGNARWIMNPNGTWQYLKDDGNYAKLEWMELDGKWYYFGSDTYMVKGWQKISGLWYYLGDDGACWMNAVTPDGYTVNEFGVWIDPETGAAVQTGTGAQGESSVTAPVLTAIDAVRLNLSESNTEPGTVRNAQVGSASNVRVDEVVYTPTYESWVPGSEVSIRVTVTAEGDRKFTNSTKYSMGSCSFTGSTGDEHTRILNFVYTPRMTLKTPSGLYVTGDNVLKWNKVDHAAQYKVVVSYIDEEDNRTSKTLTVTKAEAELEEFIGIYEELSVRVTAQGSRTGKNGKSSKSSYMDSAAAEITDLTAFMETGGVLDGEFKTSGGNLSYRDESGEKMTGWQELAGHWYYFDAKGNAAGPGWAQDEDTGLWYYFDASHHMQTGKVTDNGTEYFLNDGSYPELPVGAWVEDTAGGS